MPEEINLTPALRTWAYKNGIKGSEFRRRMKFSSSDHAYRMMNRNGTHDFTQAAWGRFIAGFGLKAFQELLQIAGVKLEDWSA